MQPAGRWSALSILAVVAVAGCDVRVGDKGTSLGVASETVTDEWIRSYPLTPGGRLEVSSMNGPMDVSPSDTGRVEIRIIREASAVTKDRAQQAVAAVSITEKAGADRVTIDVAPVGDDPPRRHPLKVRSVILVPPGISTTLRSRNGDILLTGVNGGLTVASTNGAIIVRDTSGPLTASAVNGRIGVEITSLSGAIDLTARNGGIAIGLAPTVKADLEASALNGGIIIDPQVKLERDGVPGQGRGKAATQLTATMNGGGPRISVQVSNGGVRIGLPGSASTREAAR